MKDPPFKNPVLKYYSWLFHFSVTFGFSGFRVMDLTGSLYFLTDGIMLCVAGKTEVTIGLVSQVCINMQKNMTTKATAMFA